MAVLTALGAACCFSALAVAMKRGLERNTVIAGMGVMLMCSVLVTGAFTLASVPEGVTQRAVWVFVAAGVVGEGVGRTSFLLAVYFLGPSRATPLQTATYPVLSLIGGLLLFSESVSTLRVVGAAAIAAGIWTITGEEDPQGAPRGGRWVYFLPVTAGVGFAVSDLVRKTGMEMVPYPAFGALIGAGTALTIGAVVVTSLPRLRSQMKLRTGWQWFLLSGSLAGCGVVLVFMALQMGDVSVVGPIIMSQPMIVVVLSAVLLRGIEKLTLRLVTGVAFTVLGVITISASGA